MERGERERYQRLSGTAKRVLTMLTSYAQHGCDRVDINELRRHLPNSRSLLAALAELESRDYGRLRDAAAANPAFTFNVPRLQSLTQSGLE